MNILFLDMDGVLCTPRTTLFLGQLHGETPYNYLDKEATSYLLSIVRQYDFKIVVTSVWRARDHFIDIMRTHGFLTSDFHTDWRTSYIDIGSRGLEIDEWLNRNDPHLTKYVIFEDEPSDLLSHHKTSHLVECDLYNGITFNSVIQFNNRVLELGININSHR